MEFNNDKYKLFTITRKRNFNSFTYNLGNDHVPMSETEKDLGVIMHHKLMWRDHIFSKVNTANKILRLIKRTVRGISNKDVIKKLYIHIHALHNANKSHQNEAGRSHRLVAVYLMKLQEYRCEKIFNLNIF